VLHPLWPAATCPQGDILVIRVPVKNPKAAKDVTEPPIIYLDNPDNQFIYAEHRLAGEGRSSLGNWSAGLGLARGTLTSTPATVSRTRRRCSSRSGLNLLCAIKAVEEVRLRHLNPRTRSC
jgi:hypothetical protein